MDIEHFYRTRACLTLARDFCSKACEKMIAKDVSYSDARHPVHQLWAIDTLLGDIVSQWDDAKPPYPETD